MMVSKPTDLLDRLRTETRAAHRAIDHHPLLAPLVREGLTKQIYGDALVAMYGALQALEAWVAPITTSEAGWMRYQPRLSLLAADLAELGRTPIPMRTERVPVTAKPALFGLLYVLEGSRLGGVVIARQLAMNLPSGLPRHFFSDHHSAESWQSFCAAMSAQPFSEVELAGVVAGAQAGFTVYLNHLDDCQRELRR
jgi:heme oxygenase (biliverdin-IX-beta and delta-forming)